MPYGIRWTAPISIPGGGISGFDANSAKTLNDLRVPFLAGLVSSASPFPEHPFHLLERKVRWRLLLGEPQVWAGNSILMAYTTRVVSNVPTQPLKWSIRRISREWGVSQETISRLFTEQRVNASPDGTYSTKRVFQALTHGDALKAAKLRLALSQAARSEKEEARFDGEYAPVAEIRDKVGQLIKILYDEIRGSSELTIQQKDSLCWQIANFRPPWNKANTREEAKALDAAEGIPPSDREKDYTPPPPIYKHPRDDTYRRTLGDRLP